MPNTTHTRFTFRLGGRRTRLGLSVALALGMAALASGCGQSARSDYYTVRGFYFQPSSANLGVIASVPTD